jgi:hypothetical protein
MSKYCSKYKGILLSESGKLFRGRCKMWNCQYCARENKTLWRRAIKRAIERDEELKNSAWVMFTFTMPKTIHHSKNKVLESALLIKSAWNRFLTRFKKYYEQRDKMWAKYEGKNYDRKKLTYIRVLENHKSGVLHIHFLVNLEIVEAELYINKRNPNDIRLRWLKQEAEEAGKQVIESYGFGWKHHVLMLGDNSLYATNYITKYLTKDNDEERSVTFAEILRSTKIRRIQTSRNIKAPRSLNEEVWIPRAFVNKHDFAEREKLRDLNLKRDISIGDLDANGIYPPLSETES